MDIKNSEKDKNELEGFKTHGTCNTNLFVHLPLTTINEVYIIPFHKLAVVFWQNKAITIYDVPSNIEKTKRMDQVGPPMDWFIELGKMSPIKLDATWVKKCVQIANAQSDIHDLNNAKYKPNVETNDDKVLTFLAQVKELQQKKDEKNNENAVAIIKSILELDPENGEAYAYLCRFMCRMGNQNEAIKAMMKARFDYDWRGNPRSPGWWRDSEFQKCMDGTEEYKKVYSIDL